MSRKRKFILIASALLVVIITSLIIYLILSNKDNKVGSVPIGVVSSTVSYIVSPTQPPSNISKKITNYVSGGSSFFCPNNPSICNKIQNYYSNISNKNFTEAYKYGNKIRSYDSLVSTYQNYKIVSASYIIEKDNSYSTYVTLISNSNDLELYNVLITANEDAILSSTPTSQGNKFDVDCNYINNVQGNNVCVFKLPSTDQIANLIANNFFYLPEYIKGIDLTSSETVYYNAGGDGLAKWAVLYKYNSESKVLSFISQITFTSFPDIEARCTGDTDKDFAPGGCAETYLLPQEIEKDREYLNIKQTYQLNI